MQNWHPLHAFATNSYSKTWAERRTIISCFKTFPISFIHLCVIVFGGKSLTHMPFNHSTWYQKRFIGYIYSYNILYDMYCLMAWNWHHPSFHLSPSRYLTFLKITVTSRINGNIKESLLVINGELFSDVEPHSRLLKTFIIYF